MLWVVRWNCVRIILLPKVSVCVVIIGVGDGADTAVTCGLWVFDDFAWAYARTGDSLDVKRWWVQIAVEGIGCWLSGGLHDLVLDSVHYSAWNCQRQVPSLSQPFFCWRREEGIGPWKQAANSHQAPVMEICCRPVEDRHWNSLLPGQQKLDETVQNEDEDGFKKSTTT